MNKLVFATHSEHKLDELKAMLPEFSVYGLKDIDIHDDIEENGQTLTENACIKASYLYAKSGMTALAEDTGLEVFALDGQPGVHTARYAGDQRDPIDNMNKLLNALEGQHDRSAQFRTVITLVNGEETLYFEGIVTGRIGETMSGTAGFGYDPVFIPDGYDRSFAELDVEIKNQISHRAKAVEKLKTYLNEWK